MRKLILSIAVILAAFTITDAQTFKRKAKGPIPFNRRVEYTVSPPNITEQIIEHTGFTVSYNEALLIPNWVAWELTAEEASATDVSRTDEFVPDPDVKGCSAVTNDYSLSGFERGHMAPAADMKWSAKAMAESFYLSNVCPQNPAVNSGIWLELERKCRWWAKKYGKVYIICGPYFLQESEMEVTEIGANGVAVPDAFFKCILMKMDDHWTAAAFIIPNTDDEGSTLDSCIYPVTGLEYITGYNFFAALPQKAADAVELELIREDWKIPGWK